MDVRAHLAQLGRAVSNVDRRAVELILINQY